jgi:hypothetical protein
VNRVKALRRLNAVRERQRDAAAAASSVAAQRERAAEQARDDRQEAIVVMDNGLPMLLQVERPELALELFHSDRDAANHALTSATTDLQGRQQEADAARRILAGRERELQVAEKLLEEARAERDKRITKLEQATADDLSSGRSRRKK